MCKFYLVVVVVVVVVAVNKSKQTLVPAIRAGTNCKDA
jgi:hypothetical protein